MPLWTNGLRATTTSSASRRPGPPTARQVGSFPSPTEGCDDGEPGPEPLHHAVEAGILDGTNFAGPAETAGTMKWHLGDLAPGEEAAVTVLLSPGCSGAGLPPVAVHSPTGVANTGDVEICEGDAAFLSALLCDSPGAPLAGKSLSFNLGNRRVEGTTGADGRVSLPLVLNQAGGSYQVTAFFLGDSEHGGSLDTADFVITCDCGVSGLLRDGSTFSGIDCVALKSRATVAGDWNGDGNTDILWRDYLTGENFLWHMDGPSLIDRSHLPPVGAPGWVIEGAADFNGDGKPDIVWRHSATDENFLWYMNGPVPAGGDLLPE